MFIQVLTMVGFLMGTAPCLVNGHPVRVRGRTPAEVRRKCLARSGAVWNGPKTAPTAIDPKQDPSANQRGDAAALPPLPAAAR